MHNVIFTLNLKFQKKELNQIRACVFQGGLWARVVEREAGGGWQDDVLLDDDADDDDDDHPSLSPSPSFSY